MENLKVDLSVPNGTLIVREGEAPKVYDPERVIQGGILSAPADWARDREGTFNPKQSYVVAKMTEGVIALRLDESNKFGTEIAGRLEVSPDLKQFEINTPRTFDHKALLNHLRFKKIYFFDRAQADILIGELMKFNGKVEQSLKDENDLKGTAAYEALRKVQVNFDLNFTVGVPLFAGDDKIVEIPVSICVDLVDGKITFWLESENMKELIDGAREARIEEQLKRLSQFAIVRKY